MFVYVCTGFRTIRRPEAVRVSSDRLGNVLGSVWERLRYAGLGLLAIAALKAVLFDLASVSAVWRAMSFLILGLLMLGVGVGYARAMSHTRNSQEDPRP